MADWSIQMIRDILSSIEKCGNSLKHLAAGGKVALHYSFCVRIRGIEPGVGKVSATQHLLSKIRLTGQRLTIFKVKMAQLSPPAVPSPPVPASRYASNIPQRCVRGTPELT